MVLASKKGKVDADKVAKEVKDEPVVDNKIGKESGETIDANNKDGAKAEGPKENKNTGIPAKRRAAMPATGGAFAVVYDELTNAIPVIEFGILTKLKASNGSVVAGKNDDLGKSVQVEIHSINHKYVTSPGSNAKEAKAFCRFSDNPDAIPGYWDEDEEEWVNDGATETPTAEYLAFLKNDQGYSKATTKNYMELLCTLLDADVDHEAIGQMVQVSLSPQSIKQFKGFGLHTSLKVRTGKITAEEARVFNLVAKAEEWDGNNYTIFTFKMPEGN